MKVIDLLNKIAKSEEVPKKIKIDNKILNLENGKGIKYRFENSCGTLNWDYYIELKKLNDEIEIIEEPKKIKKLETYKTTDGEDYYANILKVSKNGEYEITEDISVIVDKLNELIDYINDKENK